MSKIRKRDFKKKRNFTARRDINRHTDIFKQRKREPKGGRHGQRLEVERELEEELEEAKLEG